jgi:NADH-quinone oxidoreductase subunit J
MGETVQYIAFFIFAALTLGSALMVVSVRSLFHAALFLLLALFGVAGLFVLLVAPFLAAVQVLVYMGAIGILIIFGIMLTRGMMAMERPVNDQSFWGFLVALIVFAVLVMTLTPLADQKFVQDILGESAGEVNADFENYLEENEPAEVEYETTAEIGRVIADRNGFVLPFELASMLLTAAMIGAIVVAREDEA